MAIEGERQRMWLSRLLLVVVCGCLSHTAQADYHSALDLCEIDTQSQKAESLTFKAQQAVCLVRRICPAVLTAEIPRRFHELGCADPKFKDRYVPRNCAEQTFFQHNKPAPGAPATPVPPVTCPFPARKCPTGKRVFMITYGPPGAGKSSAKKILLDSVLKEHANQCVYEALVDDMVARIPGYKQDMAAAALSTPRLPPLSRTGAEWFADNEKNKPKTDNQDALRAHRMATVYFGYRRHRAADVVNDFFMGLAIDDERSVVLETTGLSDTSWLINWAMETPKGRGMIYWIVYTLCDLETLLKRVAARASAPDSDGRRPSDEAVRQAFITSQTTVFDSYEKMKATGAEVRFTIYDTVSSNNPSKPLMLYDSTTRRCREACTAVLKEHEIKYPWVSQTFVFRKLLIWCAKETPCARG